MRAIPVLFLIAGLLVCPYRCMGITGEGCAIKKSVTRCSCCHHDQTDAESNSGSESSGDEEESPASRGECPCGDCVCDGALQGDHSKTKELASVVEPQFDILLEDLAPVQIGPNWKWSVGPPASVSLTGRSLRFALQSLQV